MAIRKIRHREKVCVGILVCWKPEIHLQVERFPVLAYSTFLNGWNTPYTTSQYETLFDHFTLDKTGYPFSSLVRAYLPYTTVQTNTGTISHHNTKEENHITIAYLKEEFLERDSNTGSPEVTYIPKVAKKMVHASEENLGEKAGLIEIRPHTRQHYFTNHLLNEGTLTYIPELLWHINLGKRFHKTRKNDTRNIRSQRSYAQF